MSLDAALPRATSGAGRLPLDWRSPLARLAIAWAGLVALAWADWAEMARQWWDASTYNHILLVPPILVWLVRLRWPELVRLTPTGWWPGLGLLGGAVLAWLAGAAAGINLASQLGAVL